MLPIPLPAQMKCGVVTFPGSNCDQDLIHVLRNVYGQTVEELWHKDDDLKGCDAIFLPGGFSYGDYLRSGAIARFSPLMAAIIRFADDGGIVVGICNGFQILCEAHLLPGALLRNKNQQFMCKNVWLKAQQHTSMLTREIGEAPILIPIAHGEGRYFATEEVLNQLEENGQILLKYCDADGQVSEQSNCNGSSRNIAGICNAGRNVFGLMPHPERAAEGVLGNTDGRRILDSLFSSQASLV